MSTSTTSTALRPWQGSVHASITRVNVDVVVTIQYDNGQFTRSNHVVGGLSSQAIVVLDDQARRDLLAELQTELSSAPPGADVEALKVFVDLLQSSLEAPPSHRFDAARFGPITNDESTGTLFGHLVLGVDTAATVHDWAHQLTYEQHPVVLPPGRYRTLSAADRASLAEALRTRPPADARWEHIRADAEAPAGN